MPKMIKRKTTSDGYGSDTGNTSNMSKETMEDFYVRGKDIKHEQVSDVMSEEEHMKMMKKMMKKKGM